MNTKAFLLLVIVTLVVGVGGAIVAVVVVGNGQENDASSVVSSLQSPATESRASSNEVDGPSTAQPGDQVQASEADQETSAQRREQLQDPDRQSFGAGGRLTGTIEKIEGDTVTISTQQGLLGAIMGPDTAIRTFTQRTLADLDTGLQVQVDVQLREDGTVEARSIVITPAGSEGFLAGAFGGAQGQRDPEELARLRQQFQGQFGQGRGGQGQRDPEELARLRQQFQGQFGQPGGAQGQRDPEELARLRQQFQGQFGQGRGGQGFRGGSGLAGTIEEIEGNTVTIDTLQGPLQATVVQDTTIQILSNGTLADLQTGMRVTVIGQPGEDGTVQARSIVATPEGASGFFGGGLFGGRRQPDQQSP